MSLVVNRERTRDRRKSRMTRVARRGRDRGAGKPARSVRPTMGVEFDEDVSRAVGKGAE
jgi:hypothetical protein